MKQSANWSSYVQYQDRESNQEYRRSAWKVAPIPQQCGLDRTVAESVLLSTHCGGIPGSTLGPGTARTNSSSQTASSLLRETTGERPDAWLVYAQHERHHE